MWGKITNNYVLLESLQRKMVGAGDMAGISAAYLAGIALMSVIKPDPEVLYAAGSAGLAGSLAMLLFFCRKHSGPAIALLLFFLLGIFTYCSGELGSAIVRQRSGMAQTAFAALRKTISRAGLGKDSEALVSALLTGDRNSLSRDMVAAFRDAGAAHILALSGLHLGIIYGLFKKVMSWTGRSRPSEILTSATAVCAAGFYVLMTGCSASVIRAFLFICFNEAARLCPGRRRSPLTIYAAALTVQLAFDPAAVTSAGFQLSYLAMLGIYLLFPRLEAWFPGSGKNPLKRIWDSAAITLSCQVFTAPLVWWYFRSFPLYFLITNLVALPLTEALIICAAAAITATAAGLCPPPLIHLVDILAGALTGFLEAVASIS